MSLPHASELKGAHVYLYISFVFPKFSRDIQYVSLIILYVKFDSSVFWGWDGGWGLGAGGWVEGLKEIWRKFVRPVGTVTRGGGGLDLTDSL